MPQEDKLFVGNLPNTLKECDVKKLFAHFGEIKTLKLCHNDKSAKTFAFVTFENAEHANEAKNQLNKKTINKHQIVIDFARSSNDLIVKPPTKNRKKRTFAALSTSAKTKTKTQTNNYKQNEHKRRRVAPIIETLTKSNKQIPKSRIIKITNIPQKTGIATLKQQLLSNAKGTKHHQYLIYPANDASVAANNQNVAWILHENVDDAQTMVQQFDRYIFHQSILRASFVRKLNKLYRVNIIPASLTKDTNKLKRFINDYFSKKYEFDDEENKKSMKFAKFVRNRKYNKKKSHEVIQNVIIRKGSIVIEFKKVDYALFAVQSMNGVKFDSILINVHFELEPYDAHKPKPQSRETTKTLTVSEKRIIIKMFNIAESVQYEQLKELIVSTIEHRYYEDIIYPSPDSLPQSQCAWICVQDDNMARKLINTLNGTEINHKCVGVVFMKHSIEPQKVMIRNLPDSVTKKDIHELLARFGAILDVSMKEKRILNNNALIAEHCGWCFVTFKRISAAVNAMKEMNGYKIKNKMIAIDHTLPREYYNKIRGEWKKHNETKEDSDKTSKDTKMVAWKSFVFMKDYEEKSFFKMKKNKKKRVFRETLSIPIASESLDYDWLKWFLWKHRIHIIQYETNCKIQVHKDKVEIVSCNELDVEKGKLIVKEMLDDRDIREIGYRQIMNIPFELEHADFDWILCLNGDNYRNRHEFERNTGCSFTFRRKENKLQIELMGGTKQSLQRGAHYMKKHILSHDIAERQKGMDYKYIERVHFKAKTFKNMNMNLRQMEKETKCKLRIFGSYVFENKKNVKSYVKVCAKTEDELVNGCKVIRKCINDGNSNETHVNGVDKRFWFYSGDANEGRTIFVRNLPFELTKNDTATIRDKLGVFGGIVSIKMVFDKINGNFNGSCFVQYDNTESVQMAVNNNRLITMNGRKLLIDIAVNKGAAKRMEKDKVMTKDRRNLYLAKEGIMLNVKEMDAMDKTELDRRIHSWKQKEVKLQNPNFHVSKTRLSIRNIPPFVDEKQLKKVFYECALEMRKKMEDKKDEIFEYSFPKINQTKIVRDAMRMNRSKRFGFVEFREHSDALLVLREINNKECALIFAIESTKNSGKLQIEFSVENMKKVHIHLEKRKKHQIKWRKANLEKLKDKLVIVKAQNQEDEIKKVKSKISDIHQRISDEKYLKIKQKKVMFRMKKKDKSLLKKYTVKQSKKHRKRAIKHE